MNIKIKTHILTCKHMCTVTIYITYVLTPWSRFLLEKLTSSQLVKKFPTFYGTQRFITAFTSVHHLSLSSANSIQSLPPHPTSWRSILILSSQLCLDLPSCLFPLGFPTKTLYTPPLSPIRATCSDHLMHLDLITRIIFGEECRSLSSSLYRFSPLPCSLVRGFRCERFVTWYAFTVSSCHNNAQPPIWRITPCRLSATAYSIYPQIPFILEAVSPSATWGRAMPWWQGPTYTS